MSTLSSKRLPPVNDLTIGLKFTAFPPIHVLVGLLFPSRISPPLCNVASRLSSLRDMSSILAKISLDTPANLLESELSSSSTTAESSAGAEASVVTDVVERRLVSGRSDASCDMMTNYFRAAVNAIMYECDYGA